MGILTVVAAIYLLYLFLNEKLEKPAPENQRFDWDAYDEDTKNGMPIMDQIKKQKRGEYWTTKPKPEIPRDGIANMAIYEKDKEMYGEKYVEQRRKEGLYYYKR